MQRQAYVPNVLTFAAIGFVLLAIATAQIMAAALAQMPRATLPGISRNSSSETFESSPDVQNSSSSQTTITVNGETVELDGNGYVSHNYTDNAGTDVSVTIEHNQGGFDAGEAAQ